MTPETEKLPDKLLRYAKCVYLATDETIAHDLAGAYREAAALIRDLSAKLEADKMTRLNNALFVEQWDRLCKILGLDKCSVIETVDAVESRLATIRNETLEEAAEICDEARLLITEEHPLAVAKEASQLLAQQIRLRITRGE